MEFRVLGALEVLQDGEPLAVGRRKHRQLLALLVINANRVVTTDRILEELWGDDAHGKENALWVYVSRLRSILGDPTALVTRDHGYSLVVDDDDVDSHRFAAAVSAGRDRLKDDPMMASKLLSDGLGLWRGPALEEFAYDDFAMAEIARLEELRLAALEYRVEADLRLGLAGELVAELEVVQQAHPTRESFIGQLMLALYRSGRQTESLRAFERFRRHIAEESGLEPSPELRLLEEQILLHDPRIKAPPRKPGALSTASISGPANPYKGLRPFDEDDGGQFFGRSRVVSEVLRRIGAGSSLVGLVGPSGSGKSSIVRAGVVPALRKGAIQGSDEWVVASMVPGAHPFVELEAALLRSSLDAPDSLSSHWADVETGMMRAMFRVLPSEKSRLVLVIDQFEELFMLVEDESERTRFMTGLLHAMCDPHGRVVVVFSLRADLYDKPLAYPDFGAEMGDGIVNVVPLSPDELEDAARKPAEEAGVTLEPALIVALLTDVVGQIGGLPLFQYALTELFDRRTDRALTLETYEAMGGVHGALSRRADDLYASLDNRQKDDARQLFLRLVTVSDSGGWSRRRVPGSELVALDIDVTSLHAIIDLFVNHRLLTLDRDTASQSPTVEVSHEALLTEWERLSGWLSDAREDISRRRSLAVAIDEWNAADRNGDYLFSGDRLATYEEWATASSMELTVDELSFLDAGGDRRETGETERRSLEVGARRSTRRLWALVAAVLLLAGVTSTVLIVTRETEPVRIATFGLGAGIGGSMQELANAGYARAELELGVEVERLEEARFSNVEAEYRARVDSGTDIVFMDNSSIASSWITPLIASAPDTAFVMIEPFTALPEGSLAVRFSDEQLGFVAGAAAALASETGVIGYVGAVQVEGLEAWRAGYEAGAATARPDITVLSTYASNDVGDGFTNSDRVSAVSTDLFERGADVIHAVAADASAGAFEAASQYSNETGRHVWVIAPDADWTPEIDVALRPHLLTSAVKRLDVAVYETIRKYAAGDLEPGEEILTLASGAIGLFPSEHISDDDLETIDDLVAAVVDGDIVVPRIPSEDLLPPFDSVVAAEFAITWDGVLCLYSQGTESLQLGTTAAVTLINETTDSLNLMILHHSLPALQLPSRPMGETNGYLTFDKGFYSLNCGFETGKNAPWVLSRTIRAE